MGAAPHSRQVRPICFVHALMRETLYDELSEGRRAGLHLRAG